MALCSKLQVKLPEKGIIITKKSSINAGLPVSKLAKKNQILIGSNQDNYYIFDFYFPNSGRR